MNKTRTTAGIITFAGASVASAVVSSSYPVAIWAVAFGVLYKIMHPPIPSHMTCPLLQMAATEEGVNRDVVATNTTRNRQN